MHITDALRRSCLLWLRPSARAGVTQAQDKPHKSIIKRHPTASAAVAGVAAHHIAKHHGHGVLHRHPVAAGVGAAAITHHMAKKK